MLHCPAYEPDIAARTRAWEEEVDRFIASDALAELLALFGYRLPEGSLHERLVDVRAFVDERWDYRRRAGAGERWTVGDEDPVVCAHRDVILRCAEKLGMIGVRSLRTDADAVLVLGGARAANYDRTAQARRLCEQVGRPLSIVSLGARRLLGEIEIPVVTPYVPGATAGVTTEFDVLCCAMERVLGVTVTGEEGEICEDEPNLSWAIRRYGRHVVLCAPSSEPSLRRANTPDTLQFFRDHFAYGTGSVLLMTTSSIYVNYQLASMLPIALENGWELVLCGSDPIGWHHNVVSNYLQETKGTIDAIARSLDL